MGSFFFGCVATGHGAKGEEINLLWPLN